MMKSGNTRNFRDISKERILRNSATKLGKFFSDLEAKQDLQNPNDCNARIDRLLHIIEVTIFQTRDRDLLHEIPGILSLVGCTESFPPVYTMIQQVIERLHTIFHEEIVTHFETYAGPGSLDHDNETTFLTQMLRPFSFYYNSMTLLSRYFQPFLRRYSGFFLSVVDIIDIARSKFRDLMDEFPMIRDLCKDHIIRLIIKLRFTLKNGTNKCINDFECDTNLASLCQTIMETGMFSLIEREYLDQTSIYTKVSANLLRYLSLKEYLYEVKEIIKLETDIFAKFFPNYSSSILRQLIISRLVLDNKEIIFNRNFEDFFGDFKEPQIEILKFSYMCFAMCNEPLGPLEECFCNALKEKTAILIENYSEVRELVPQLLFMRGMVRNVVFTCFERDEVFLNAFERAWSQSLHFHPNFIAKKTVVFIHHLLCSRTIKRKNILVMIDIIRSFLNLVHDKSAFQTMYHSLAATRFVNRHKLNLKMELMAMKILKNVLGNETFYKLDGMMKDLSDINVNDLPTPKNKKLYIYGLVYSKCFWPSRLSIAFKMPKFLERKLTLFQERYKTENPKRKIKLHVSATTVVLRFKKQLGSVHIVANLIQMAILLEFNKEKEISVGDLMTRVCVDKEAYFFESLKHMINFDILTYVTPKDLNESLSTSDILIVNRDSTIQEDTNVALCISFKGDEGEPVLNPTRKEIVSDFVPLHDKCMYLDAAIVRVMKNAKSLGHIYLYESVSSNLEFPVTQELFQLRVTDLISKDYIKVNPDTEITTYSYVD